MTKDQLLKLPLWQYTGEQFLELLDSHFVKTPPAPASVTSDENVATTAKRRIKIIKTSKVKKERLHRILNYDSAP